MNDERVVEPTSARALGRRRVGAFVGAVALALVTATLAGAATASAATPGSAAGASFVSLAATSGSTAIHNNFTGQCMDVPGYGVVGANAPVSQYYCNTSESGDNQDWHLVPTRVVGGVQLFEIVNDKSGLCLDLPGYGSDAAGTHLYVYGCNSTPANDNQEWSVWSASVGAQPVGTMLENFKASGSKSVNPISGGECLDVTGWANTNDETGSSDWAGNLPLTVYGCYNSAWGNYGYDDHLWAFGDYWNATP